MTVTRSPSRPTRYGTIFISSFTSSCRRPMNRLIENTVFSGLVTAWRFATCPTSRSPLFVNATTDGVSRLPSGFVMTVGSPPSMTATTELVVPRSMPMILLMLWSLRRFHHASGAAQVEYNQVSRRLGFRPLQL